MSKNGRMENTYSTIEAAEIVGVSFRQLDYWLRQGYVAISSDASGSGTRRRFTTDEVAALSRVVARLNEAHRTINALASGRLWTEEHGPLRQYA